MVWSAYHTANTSTLLMNDFSFFLFCFNFDEVLKYFSASFLLYILFQSSVELLRAFSKNFLSAEGNVVSRLSRIGCILTWVQQPAEELDHPLRCLATDLRSGLALA